MNSEELIKNNSLSDISVDVDQKVVFVEIALTAINMARIEGYNQAITDASECLYDDEMVYKDSNDYSLGVTHVPSSGKLEILNLKK